MKNRIEKLLKENEKISLEKIAKELGISLIEVLREAPTVRKYLREELFEILRGWEKVFSISSNS